MNLSVPIMTLIACSVGGCATSNAEQSVVVSSKGDDRHIGALLRQLPVPVPDITPYDEDNPSREAYLSGFREGWDKGIENMLRYVRCEPPSDLSSGSRISWIAGWRAGAEAGVDRWFQKPHEEPHPR
jgi:ribosome modulation factor